MLFIPQYSSVSLYIHSPWCWQKCPYCDFNAYARPQSDHDMLLMERAYLQSIERDLLQMKRFFPWITHIRSIYLGGGTPSLFSPFYWEKIFQKIRLFYVWEPSIEVTMEVSPKSRREDLIAFAGLGVNRFSVGVQSFDDDLLRLLGREHHAQSCFDILDTLSSLARPVRINVDLIYGLAAQTLKQADTDLAIATSYPVSHLSWYELMIEPNTKFAHTPHVKASEDQLTDFEEVGRLHLQSWDHYEISAYCKNNDRSQHNLTYWTYGDYLGIGAGAHSKITVQPGQKTLRFYKTRYPQDYIRSQRVIIDHTTNNALDFLLVRLRLFTPLEKKETSSLDYYSQKILQDWWDSPKDPNLIQKLEGQSLALTPLGRRSVNVVLESFIEFQEKWLRKKQ